MTALNKWPLQSQCDAFYGNPRSKSVPGTMSREWALANLVYVECPWRLTDYKNEFHHIRIHRKCAASLSLVLNRTWNNLGKSEAAIRREGYHVFSGSAVFRKMRNYDRLSMHSYGCAIDWHAPGNMQGDRTPIFSHDEPLLEEFRAERWVAGRDWRGDDIDAMHVQAAIVG